MEYDVCVVGGFGHVGLPMALAFADKGLKVCALDINKVVYEELSKGNMPFIEWGAEELLQKVLKSGNLKLSLDQEDISRSKNIIVTIGTPVGEHFSPELNVVEKLLSKIMEFLKDGQLLILRSTVYPGTTNSIARYVKNSGKNIEVVYCPERIVEGFALRELNVLPQIVASDSKEVMKRAGDIFRHITNDIIEASPLEAELSKLFSNILRYAQFGIANQLFMVANDAGADYYRVKEITTFKYPRAANMLSAGLASGPCLFKDSVQLNAFNNYNFPLGNAAIMINDGLPFYIYNKLRQSHDLSKKSVGILGMAFKAESDDKRDSQSYTLKELFEFDAKRVYCSDPYIKDKSFVDAKELVEKSDIVILAVPHKTYTNLHIGKDKIVIDIWNFYKQGCRF